MKNNYTFTEIKEKLQRCYLRQLRRHKELLTLSFYLDKLLVCYWQRDCCLWQKEIVFANLWTQDNLAWWQEVEKSLQDVFVWARIKDMADTLLLLDEAFVQQQNLSLPLFSQSELLQAVAWEAEQMVPWEKGSFVTAFAGDRTEADVWQLQLWAWPKKQITSVCAMAANLRLDLQAVLVAIAAEKVHKVWYEGDSFKYCSLLDKKEQWRQKLTILTNSDRDYVKIIFAGCFILAAVVYGSAQGGLFLAQKYLQTAQQQLEQYAVWERRYEQNQKIEADLQRSQILLKNMQQNASHTGDSIKSIGEQVGRQNNCWLELLRGDIKAKEWQLNGSCSEADAANKLVERLENTQKFSQIRLQNIRQEKGTISFVLQLKEK